MEVAVAVQPQAVVQSAPSEVVVKKTTTTFVKDITEEEITEEEKDNVKKEVKIIKKIVKKESGEPPRFTKPISPQVQFMGISLSLSYSSIFQS